jgi:hypothetical protein
LDQTPSNIPIGAGSILRQFQLETNTSKKLDPAYGRSLMMYIESTISAGIGNNYYWPRNTRFRMNRNWANGKIDVQSLFADRMEFNGKVNYINLKWSCIMIVNRIISGLVGRWMGRNEKVDVTATDPLSIKDKKKQYAEAEFFFYNQQKIAQLQQASGLKLSSPDQFIPEDQTSLDLWVEEGQHLPEEIAYEKTLNDIFEANGLYGIIKEKILHDSAEVGLVSTRVWMDDQGLIHTDYVKPENAIYSYSEFPDMRDSTWRGEVKGLKIRELRAKYGPGTKRNLTEEEIWTLAQTCRDYQLSDKLRWSAEWNVSLLRPYDEWNLDIIICEIKSLDKETHLVTETRTNKRTIIKKVASDDIQISDNQSLVSKSSENIYVGVYARTAAILLDWSLKENQIRPQDPRDSGKCDFSYSFYLYQNIDMRNIAIPEKIEEPVEQMLLASLKIQQLIARMIPPGAAINLDALQELALGKAINGEPIEPEKLYEQTGRLYYRGRDAEGNAIPIPITELTNAGFVPTLQGLITDYQFHYGKLKDELGEDPNLISAATKPRVTASNVQASQMQADAANDHMYDAYLYLMEETARKAASLLKDSVKFSGVAYRHLLKEDQVSDRIFSTKTRMLPNDDQIQQFQAYMNQMIASSPDLFMYCDPWKLERIAKEDLKLAEKMFLLSQKKAIQAKAQQAAQNSQQAGQVQIQSAQAKAQSEMQLEQQKSQNELAVKQLQWQQEKELGILSMFTAIYSKGLPLPSELQAVEKEMIANVMIPVFGQNIGNKIAMQQGLQSMMQPDQGTGAPPGPDTGPPPGAVPPDQAQAAPQPSMQPAQ